MTNKYSCLHFVKYKSIPNWSTGYILGHDLGFTEKYPLARIGDFIRPAKNAIVVEDDKVYKQVTLKINGGGAVLRGVMNGSSIGTKKQFLAKEGQFVMSKIDARNGAFGIISKELNDAIVTGDFPLFSVNSDLISTEYLFLISTTKSFVRFAQSCSRGTTNRRRIDVNLFLQQQIPLPSLEKQKALVDAYQRNFDEALLIEKSISVSDKDIKRYIEKELCIIKADGNFSTKGLLSFASYRFVTQWGVDFINQGSLDVQSSLYKCIRISEICSISSGGTPSRGRKDYYGGNIPWIKTGELRNEILLDTEEKITQLGLDNSSAKLYPAGAIAIAMYGATIGKTAKLGIAAATNQACAVLTPIANDKILTDYLWIYLQSQTDKLKSLAYGGAQPNINAGIIANYRIPLPPLSVQQEIVDEVQKRRAQIASCREQAIKLRQDAIAQFEQAIFE